MEDLITIAEFAKEKIYELEYSLLNIEDYHNLITICAREPKYWDGDRIDATIWCTQTSISVLLNNLHFNFSLCDPQSLDNFEELLRNYAWWKDKV